MRENTALVQASGNYCNQCLQSNFWQSASHFPFGPSLPAICFFSLYLLIFILLYQPLSYSFTGSCSALFKVAYNFLQHSVPSSSTTPACGNVYVFVPLYPP